MMDAILKTVPILHVQASPQIFRSIEAKVKIEKRTDEKIEEKDCWEKERKKAE